MKPEDAEGIRRREMGRGDRSLLDRDLEVGRQKPGAEAEFLPNCSSWSKPRFSASALLTFGTRYLFVVGTVPCILRYLAVSLASTHQKLVASPHHPVLTTKDASRHYQMSWGREAGWVWPPLVENHWPKPSQGSGHRLCNLLSLS